MKIHPQILCIGNRIGNASSRLRRGISTRMATTNFHLSGRANSPVRRIDVRLSPGVTPFGSAFGCSIEQLPALPDCCRREEAKIAWRSSVCGRKQLCKPTCEIVYSHRPANRIPGSSSSPSGAARWRRNISFISGLITRATTRRRRHDRCPSLVNTLFADEPGTSAIDRRAHV